MFVTDHSNPPPSVTENPAFRDRWRPQEIASDLNLHHRGNKYIKLSFSLPPLFVTETGPKTFQNHLKTI